MLVEANIQTATVTFTSAVGAPLFFGYMLAVANKRKGTLPESRGGGVERKGKGFCQQKRGGNEPYFFGHVLVTTNTPSRKEKI